MSTDSSAPSEPSGATPEPSPESGSTLFARLGADWVAVIVAGVLVVLAGLGLLPSIPFLIK